MRTPLAAALIPIAALVAAAKPADNVRNIQDEARRVVFRAQGLAVCLTTQTAAGAPDDARGRTCTCALDRYVASHPGPLPPLDADNFRSTLGSELAACGGGAATDSKIVAAPAVEPGPNFGDAPLPPPSSTDTNARKQPPPSLPNPLSSLNMPSLGSMPGWVWALIGLIVGLFLIRRLFRRDDRSDLVGPPSSMTPKAVAQPRSPEFPKGRV
jgi:hypothetical protein